jgi:hypothetical protein
LGKRKLMRMKINILPFQTHHAGLLSGKSGTKTKKEFKCTKGKNLKSEDLPSTTQCLRG